MIDVKQAVAAAMAYFHEVMGADFDGRLLLEEVELSEDQTTWCVCVSAPLPPGYTGEQGAVSGLARAFEASRSAPAPRIYRDFRVNAATGEVRAMKTRQMPHMA